VVVTSAIFWFCTGLLGVERILEMVWAGRNEQRLRDAGYVEFSPRHMTAIVVLHLLYFASLVVEFTSSPRHQLQPAFIALFALAQILRFWVMSVMGERFTARILVKRGERLVTSGPYRFLRHPIYVVLELEFISLALLVGAYWTALIFGLANAFVLLLIRIPAEERALRSVQQD